ncbi:MAG: helix-turn-helix domain-containing protein [Armatimonadota bacterium]
MFWRRRQRRKGKDEYVSMGSLERICGALHCNIGDVVEFT